MVERLECVAAMLEVSVSTPDRGEHKTPCSGREPSDCISFRRPVKNQWFHALKHEIQSQEQFNNITLQTLYTLELDLDPFPTDGTHFLLNVQ